MRAAETTLRYEDLEKAASKDGKPLIGAAKASFLMKCESEA